jgi:hypothetical protein
MFKICANNSLAIEAEFGFDFGKAEKHTRGIIPALICGC